MKIDDLIAKLRTITQKGQQTEKKHEYMYLFEQNSFNSFISHTPVVIAVYNFEKLGYDFVSENVRHITGYSSLDFMSPKGVEIFFSQIEEPHQAFFVESVISDLMVNTKTYREDYQSLKFAACIKMKRKNGEVFWALFYTYILNASEKGVPIQSCIVLLDVSQIKDNNFAYKYTILQKPNAMRVLSHELFSQDFISATLSKRELEILNYISQGFTSEEISSKLNISINTIKTHRNHILKKTNSKNFMELIKHLRSF